ncbi:hypothetical protein IID24_02025 [Patescibacteria group bacterium]|nr:hypothetical protein [Patescibacteria group bacterium]
MVTLDRNATYRVQIPPGLQADQDTTLTLCGAELNFVEHPLDCRITLVRPDERNRDRVYIEGITSDGQRFLASHLMAQSQGIFQLT